MADTSYKLLNTETGTLEDVPIDNMAQALSSGIYRAKRGQRFDIVDPAGVGATIGAEDALSAIEQGFTFKTTADVERRERHLKYSTPGQTAIGLAEAGLSGLTLGGSDIIASKIDPEGAGARREELGGLGTAVEVAGAVVPILASGGSGAAVKGGAMGLRGVAAAMPTAKLAKGGAALATELGKKFGVKGAAKYGLARHVAAKSLAAAGEGGIYGTGYEISRAALEDRDVTAESLLSGFGTGALLAGSLVGGGSAAFGLTKKAAGGLWGKFSDTVGSLTKEADGLVKKGGEANLAKAAKIRTKVDEMVLEYRKAAEQRAADQAADLTASPYTKEGQQAALTAEEKAVKIFSPESRAEHVRRYSEMPVPRRQAARKNEAWKLANETETAITDLNDKVIPRLEKLKNEILDSKALKNHEFRSFKLKDELDDWIKELAKTEGLAGATEKAAKIQAAVDDMFTLQAGPAKKGFVLNPRELKNILAQVDEAIKLHKAEGGVVGAYGLRRRINDALIREIQLADPKLAAKWARVMKGQQKAIQTWQMAKELGLIERTQSGKWVTKGGVKGNLPGIVKRDFDNFRKLDDQKFMEFFETLDSLSNSNIKEKFLDRIALESVIGAQGPAIEALGKEATIAALATVADHGLRRNSAIIRMYQWLLKKATAGVKEGLLSDTPTISKDAAKKIGEIFNMVKNDRGAIKDAADGFFGKAKGKVKIPKFGMPESKRLTAPMSNALMRVDFGSGREAKTEREKVKILREDIDQLKASPERMAEIVGRLDTIHRIDPELAMRTQEKVKNSVKILDEKLPRSADQYSELNGGSWQPSDADVADVRQMVEVLENPGVVLSSLNLGTLTPKMVEAFEDFFPRKFEELKLEIMQRLPGANLSYGKRGMLMFLFGETVDKSYERDTLNRIQGNFFNEPTEGDIAGGRTGKVRAKGADKLTYGEDSATEMQRIEQGGM